MKSEIFIQKGTLADLEGMKQLFVETISSICSADYNAEQIKVWTSGVSDESRWNDIILNQYVMVAKQNDLIVGFATLKNNSYIDLFYVHKNFQGQKVASQLYTLIEKEALQHQQAQLTSDVSITAKPFFEKIGFEVLKEQTVIRQNVAFTNYKMIKRLINT